MIDWPLLMAAAALAGWVDAVVGGGGLILIPMLLLLTPVSPAVALATNKLAAVGGTAAAAATFARRTDLRWRLTLPAAAVAALASCGGAALVSHLDRELFTPIILGLLLCVAAFVVINPQPKPRPERHGRTVALILLAVGVSIGFYDGLFGPGTGTFLIIALVTMIGTDFVTSSGMAKVINTGSNLGALGYFAATGSVWWTLGLALAVCNITGGIIGARMALNRGSGFVRVVLLVVVTALVARLGWQYVFSG